MNRKEEKQMKKLLVALLALVMMMSFAVAETAQEEKVDYTQIPEEIFAKGAEISITDFVGQPAKVWISDELSEAPLTDELKQSGIFMVLGMAEGTETEQVAFQFLTSDATMEQFVASLKENAQVTSVDEPTKVHGFDAVSYNVVTEQGNLVFATYKLEKGLLNIYFPISKNPDFLKLAAYMASSLQVEETAE